LALTVGKLMGGAVLRRFGHLTAEALLGGSREEAARPKSVRESDFVGGHFIFQAIQKPPTAMTIIKIPRT
jgi:hypothetical protein